MNCWDYMNCGRQKGGFAEEELGVCPAYPGHGQRCFEKVGTFCSNNEHNREARIRECEKCPYYQWRQSQNKTG